MKTKKTILACTAAMIIILPVYLFYCLACCCETLQEPVLHEVGAEAKLYDHAQRLSAEPGQLTEPPQERQIPQPHHLKHHHHYITWSTWDSQGTDEMPGMQNAVAQEHSEVDAPLYVRNGDPAEPGGTLNEASGGISERGRTQAASPFNASNTFSGFGQRRLPEAIIIGVKKGGTRALLEFIRVHPDVRAVGAEPHFFDRNYDKGFEWYRNLMPRTLEGQLTMEKTPSYFVTPEVPARIHAMSAHTKLIVVVRDPVTRAISDYTQTLSKAPRLPAFEDLAFRNHSIGLVDSGWSAVRIGLYAKHLEHWLRHFPQQQLLFVSGERLVTDPARELARVQDFLGLKRIISDKHFYFNQTKGFPCLKKPEGSSLPHCLGKSKGRRHPAINARYIQQLREFYKPFNLKFYQMTGQDFGWE